MRFCLYGTTGLIGQQNVLNGNNSMEQFVENIIFLNDLETCCWCT